MRWKAHTGGLTAGASLGAGVKANALIGGFNESVVLNPVSVESQTGGQPDPWRYPVDADIAQLIAPLTAQDKRAGSAGPSLVICPIRCWEVSPWCGRYALASCPSADRLSL
ncbi:DUF992 domain-containing protein [Roseibium salinum]|nr:DUF992 domain-containing protein [Roseibium salinum]